MSTAWSGCGQTHRGLIRWENQDAYAVHDDLALWVIADGMGGHAGGAVASQLAVETLHAACKHDLARIGDHPEALSVPRLLSRGFSQANHVILEKGRRQRELLGMGTTLIAMHIDRSSPPRATIAHVGDSRVYCLHDRSLKQLTRDHSFVEEQIERGRLTKAEAAVHPKRHILTRAVGVESVLDPDVVTLTIDVHDIFLLCTDGLTKMLGDDDILHVLLTALPAWEQAGRQLILEANRRGGEDNTTVILVGNPSAHEPKP